MGLSSKQVSGDGFDWAKNLMQTGALEFPNVTPMRQQQQHQQQQSVAQLKCPRCDSINTKFCYYNNYNRSQPRHFCKSCRRHWTKGGTLRNVPVGGGRKNKRLKTTNTTTNKSNTTRNSNGAIQPQQHVQQQSLPLDQFNDQKKFSEILYQSLLQPTSSLLPSSQSNYLLGSTLSLDSLLSLPNLPSTSVSSFNNPCSMPTSFNARFQLPNVFNYNEEGEITKDLLTNTTIATTMTAMPVQWQIPTSNSSVDSSYWNWEDLNTFISTDVKEVLWDDSQNKD